MKIKESVIYCIKSITSSRIYVGSTVDFENRKRKHITGLRLNKHHSNKLQNHVNKYSLNDVYFEILEKVDNSCDLINREQYFIDLLNPYFNCCPTAGSSLNYRHTKESKLKMSKPKRKKILNKNNNKRGMKPTDLQYTYKKVIGFTNQQKKALQTLESYGINVNNFIRIAVSEKIKAEWKSIKESKTKGYCPF